MNADDSDVMGGPLKTLRPCNEVVLQDVEVQMDQEEEFGSRNPGKLPDPKLPSKDEVEKHYLTHLPYRSWCEACVAGRGIGDQHRAGPELQVPVISCDYLLVTKKGIKSSSNTYYLKQFDSGARCFPLIALLF